MVRATPNRISGILQAARSALLGPQLMAFLPAAMLTAYWFGGEGLLLASAVTLPAVLAFSDLARRPRTGHKARDPITGLPSKSQLIRSLDAGIHPSGFGDDDSRVCLLIELDNFKSVEDQYGDLGAETVLRATADRLKGVMREHDMIAGLGAGRFGISLGKTPRVDLEAMIQLSGRIQDALAAPVSLDSTRVLVTASVGFALPSRVPDQTGEAFFAAAESALDEAHKSGPNSVRAFARGMRPRIATPDNVTKAVVKAMDQGQIIPWFQPQISTDTGELTGFEALARWHHPERGMIAPGAFLPAIAKAGLFERLGEIIVFHALTAIRDWDRAGLNVPSVAVNFAPDDLRNPKLFDKIRWELDRFELAPNRLTIEILEDVVARSDDDTTTRNIAALAKLGCAIDLDDFGTGHASIANIRRFDVNRIKIDRSFITHVDTDRDQQNMVAAILTMAERLGLDTLGEGVESHGEHAMLAQLGCGHVQGYSIAKPMPFDDTATWILQQQNRVAKTPQFPRRAV